jgi:peroxiredoxin
MGLCIGFLAWLPASWTFAQEGAKGGVVSADNEMMHSTTQPTEKPVAPATQEAMGLPDNVKISPEARPQLEQMRDAYHKLQSLELAGTLAGHFDVAGVQKDRSSSFTAVYAGPGKFNCQRESSLRIGSNGHMAFAFAPDRAQYLQKEWSKGQSLLKDMPQPMKQMIQEENPSLALALSGNAAAELLGGMKQVDRGPDVQIGDKSYVCLDLIGEAQSAQVLLDPQTHLMRRVVEDQSKMLEKLGQVDIKAAAVSWDYMTISSDAKVNEELLAWSPPADAVDTTSAYTAMMAVSAADKGDKSAPNPLEGKEAPDFKLSTLDGHEVSLADLKGSVVVLDFWATWCPPCVESLPHLQQVYLDNKAAGVKVFGINLDDDKSKVAPFVLEKKLTFPILLDDGQSNLAEKYGASAIPQTVLIGKDGKVIKVLVGFSSSTEAELRKAIAQAMHESPKVGTKDQENQPK